MASSHATKSKQSLGRTSLLDLIHECSCMNYLLTHFSPLPPLHGVTLSVLGQTNTQTNKQANKQTNKQTKKRTNKRTHRV